jgi:hypothetical protein
MACPFNIPKFEWYEGDPRIVKCELCSHRLAEGKEPACTAVCPVKAVIFGPRAEMLPRPTGASPRPRTATCRPVYGETDGGGTQVLYLSPACRHTELGLPDLDDRPVPELARTVQHGIYKGFAAPVALYGVLALVMWRNRRAAGQGGGGGGMNDVHARSAAGPHPPLQDPPRPGHPRHADRRLALRRRASAPSTGLSDGYPWGLWIAFDVVTGTALACGGYAVALLVYILNKGSTTRWCARPW